MGNRESKYDRYADLDRLLATCLRLADEAGLGLTAIHIATARDVLAKENLGKARNTGMDSTHGNEDELPPRS
jgi:hypothetical protein